ncbi:MAG: DegT/DnrJ/EryC1/StrS family aminotransferase [Polyangiales bacterium]
MPLIDEGDVFNQYVIRAEQRDALQNYLSDRGIQTAVYYPLGLHLQGCFADLGYRRGDLPVTERACDEVLALPVYPGLSRDAQNHVVRAIASFYSWSPKELP